MQKLAGVIRKAITEYDMIQPGDRVAVGLSGGKDSVALLAGLAEVRKYMEIPFELVALTMDPGFGGVPTDYSPITAFCSQIGVEHIIKQTQIGEIIFDIRQESNPCSLCARMRRGALHDATLEQNCNKIALGHHMDDAVETFLMNLFQEGRIGCFRPVTYLSRKNITMIRPLCLAEEKEISSAVRRLHLPVVKSVCPVDGVTNRQSTKEWIHEKEREDRGFKKRIFGAMRRGHVDGW